MGEDARHIVRLDVAADLVELAADALWQGGPSAVAIVDLADGRVSLTADLVDLGTVVGWPYEVLQIDGDDHLDAWRAFARPVRAGRRLVVQPPWVPLDESMPDDVVVLVDPGRAFGSGAHPATRLALEALEDLVRAGDRVIDVGCGSGVLAVAAVRLGAREVSAVDVDPAAIDATRANAERNGVGAAVAVSLGSTDAVGEPGDVVVANIGVAVLRDLGPALVALVRPRGHLVLSGLLEGQEEAVIATLAGCEILDRYEAEGWVAPVLRRVS